MRSKLLPHAARLGILGSLALGGACASAPAAPAPLLEVDSDHFAGSILTGPLAAPAPDDEALADPWPVELRLAYLESPPGEAGEPLSAGARHVYVEGGDPPLRTRGELAVGARRLGTDASLARGDWEVRRLDVIWPGATTTWRLRRNAAVEDAPAAAWDELSIRVSRRGDDPRRVEVGLALAGLVVPPPQEDDEERAPSARAPVRLREHVVLDTAPRRDGVPQRFFFPSARAGSPRGGFLVELRLPASPPEPAAMDAVVERARAELAASLERARERAASLTPSEGFRFERESALRALESQRLRRPALVFLADATGAELTGELALAADEAVLADYVAAVHSRLAAEEVPKGDPAAFGWFLESTAHRWLARQALDPELDLAPELASLLLRHTGALGRYPDLVLEAVSASADLAELDARVVRENRIFLEDASPAARVRAFDWLAARGAAPAGFDPLGTRADRRAALAAQGAGERSGESAGEGDGGGSR